MTYKNLEEKMIAELKEPNKFIELDQEWWCKTLMRGQDFISKWMQAAYQKGWADEREKALGALPDELPTDQGWDMSIDGFNECRNQFLSNYK